ncbi:MAG: ribosome maturation factor RimM [Gammaproteobacteria bacterium]|nr:ribosome maturation factor RimM [Gammaproteobacteria bacterium]
MAIQTPVVIGKITGVHGVKGWVKVFSHTEPRLNIIEYNPWLINTANGWKEVDISNGKPQGKTIVAKLKDIDDRDEALKYIGSEIAINESQLKELNHEDYYWRELENLQVINLKGETLGTVSHLIETGANDVMVVALSDALTKQLKQNEILIPYLYHDVVKKVDLEASIIEVDWDNEYF